MKNKKWFIINEQNQIISKMLDSYEEALELWNKLNGERQICETVYG